MLSRALFVRIILVQCMVSLFSTYCFAQSTSIQQIPETSLPSKESILKIQKDDMVKGDAKAPVTLIEYASLSCTHCAAFYNNTFEELQKKYIDTGKVRYVFRDFPLNLPALHATMLVRCAPQDKTDKFINTLFSTQNTWATKKNYLEFLSNIAKLGGMSGSDFDACIANKALEDKITLERFQAAKVLEVRSTPAFFINGTPYAGLHNLESLSAVIDPLLAPASDPKSLEAEPKVSQEPSKE